MLEVNWKEREAVAVFFVLAGAAGEAKELKELPAILFTVAIVGEDGINEIVFFGFSGWVLSE